MENKEKQNRVVKQNKNRQEYSLKDLKENYKIGIEYYENVEEEIDNK